MNDHQTERERALAGLRSRLADALAGARLTKAQLAVRAGLGRTTVHGAFQHGAPVPSAATVAALTKALGLPADELLQLRRTAVAGNVGEDRPAAGPGLVGLGWPGVEGLHDSTTHQPSDSGWPVEIGPVPTLATAFQPRTGLRERIDAARADSGAVVLTQTAPREETRAPDGRHGRTRVLSGGGGVGKSQLAASYATDALEDGTDLVLWTSAAETGQVITTYAQTALRVRAPGADEQDPEADARAFLAWLKTTRRRWLIVLDDVTDPAAMQPWWPISRTGTGWVLATTRLHDARMTGGGRTRVRVDVYTPEEADGYLRARLGGDGMGHLLDQSVGGLADALGCLPLALGHAAAYMINEEISCTAYLQRFNDRQTRLEEALPSWADTEGYGRQITTTLLMSLEAARAVDPTGIAEPVLRLTALLDPAGHPHALWATSPVLDRLEQHRQPSRNGERERPTAAEASRALRVLHRYALITHTGTGPRSVRIHALTARAVRETLPHQLTDGHTQAAAGGLLACWPEQDTLPVHRDLAAALRACTESLYHHTGDRLRHPDAPLVLHRAGLSLLSAGLHTAATAHWQHLATVTEHTLGPDHPDTLATRNNLANACQQAGRTGDAIRILEQVLADSERVLGPGHPDTLAPRGSLATSYGQAGRIREAVRIHEQVLADSERTLGPEHPQTLTTRNNLAVAYGQAGRIREAVRIHEQVLADRERTLGPEHPTTLTTRNNLANSYWLAGRIPEAARIHEQVLADRERILGPDHPHTLNTRSNLATAYRRGRSSDTTDAVRIEEQLLADTDRILGPEHPTTLTTRSNLATSYRRAWRTGDAIRLEEQLLADTDRILGPEHPQTLTTRSNLANSYRQAGRT
ncbi:FxSxx-COOH system tetratricopeptide repeat protein, partial [Streptomyces albipurpureus]